MMIAASNSTHISAPLKHFLVQIHATAFIFAWMFLVVLGSGSARHLRSLLPSYRPFGLRLWFHLHRIINLIALGFMAVGLLSVLIGYEWRWTGPKPNGTKNWGPGSLHTLAGVLAVGLAFSQPVVAFFRCDSLDSRRWAFNWLHRVVGVGSWTFAAICLGIACRFFAKRLVSTEWAFTLFTLNIFITIGSELFIEWWMATRRPDPLDFERFRISEVQKSRNRKSAIAVPRLQLVALLAVSAANFLISFLLCILKIVFGDSDGDVADFRIDVLSDEIENAKVLAQSVLRRFPPNRRPSTFQNGFNVDYLRNLTESFCAFDWNQHQKFLNTFDHKQTLIDNVAIHFVRIVYPQRPNERRIPLLVIPRFFGTFWDFYKISPILGNPKRFGFDFGDGNGKSLAFEVVIPSLPGSLFSGYRQDLDFFWTSAALEVLMKRLGYSQFFVWGDGDLGSHLGSLMATESADSVLGLFLSQPVMDFSFFFRFRSLLTEIWNLELNGWTDKWRYLVGAVESKQRFGTVGIQLNSSPLALMAFLGDLWAPLIDEGFRSHPQGSLQSHSTVDDFLTECFLFWITNSVPTVLDLGSKRLSEFERISVLRTPVGIIIGNRGRKDFRLSELSLRFRRIENLEILEDFGALLYFENPQRLAESIFGFVESQLK